MLLSARCHTIQPHREINYQLRLPPKAAQSCPNPPLAAPVVSGHSCHKSTSQTFGRVSSYLNYQQRRRIITETFADPVMEAPEVEEEEEQRWDPTTQTAMVVGAGPTGALAAHYLAMRGYRVEVYDKGARPAPGDAASVPLVLTSRGAIAFEELGLTDQSRVGPTATPLRGVWDVVGRRLRPLDASSVYRRAFVTDRSGLARDIIEAAERRYPDTVRFHFNKELVRAELKNRVAAVRTTPAATVPCPSSPPSPAPPSSSSGDSSQPAASPSHPSPTSAAPSTPSPSSSTADGAMSDEQEVEVSYDLLVGADGVDSSVRRILKSKVKDFGVIRPVEEEAAHWAVRGLPRPAREPLVGFFTHRPQEYVYEWCSPGGPVVRLFIDLDGAVGGTVSGLEGVGAGGVLDEQSVAGELTRRYPDFPPEWAQAIGQQVSSPSSPPPRHPAILQCSQFFGPRAVLVGDAAHAVTAASEPAGLGQGPSAAVESVRTLALVLRGAQDDLEKVPEVYSNVRGDAVMAMQMLEFMALTRGGEVPRQLRFASMWFAASAFVTQGFRRLAGLVGGLLAALLPKTFLSAPQVMARLEDRRIGYSEVIKMLQGYSTPVVTVMLGGIFVGLFMAFNRVLA